MITVAQTHTLLASIILMSVAAALVWLTLALPARIAPRASLAMAGANAAAAASLTLHVLRGVAPDGVTYRPGEVLAVTSFALLGMAVSALTRRRLAWKPGTLTVAIVGVLLLTLSYDDDLRWQARIVNWACAGLALAASLTAWRALRPAMAVAGGKGAQSPAWLTLPLLLIAALMTARAVEATLLPGITPDLSVPNEFNLVFLWIALVLALLQNATLAFLVLIRMVQRIEHLLERDPLTQTLNRRALDQALAHAHAWHLRGRGYAVVLIDMDRFKQLNDTLGHAAGDAALRQMAQGLQPCLREVDRFGRWGGEEFCVLLPDTNLAGAALVAERMRVLLNDAPLCWLGQRWPLSASFGVAEAEDIDAGSEAVLARADAALYRAKHQGRNLVQA